jgi:tetratricopeptide (TPR) repeat protein
MSYAACLCFVMSFSLGIWAQEQGSPSNQGTPSSPNSSSGQNPASSSQTDSAGQNSRSSGASGSGASGSSIPSEAKPSKRPAPDLAPPRSDRVNAADLGDGVGESSSKDTQIDLAPPADDAKKHPESSDALTDAGSGSGDVAEFHPWNPHKAAKDVEVGDFYFKRKNYRAAEDRYREALLYKDNDAIATFRLAVCLDKLERPNDARAEYESYLKILPHGPQAEEAQKAIDRLKGATASANSPK